VDEFARLYVIPEMGHCGGGPVPEFGARLWPAAQDSQHSIILALERWVERGIGPDAIIATKYRIDEDRSSGIERTRPLCRYPQQAVWTGKGNPNDAANYLCSGRR
jgi:Tannase and feruloyl esterase